MNTVKKLICAHGLLSVLYAIPAMGADHHEGDI